jgi:exopolysaccharide biosynthesis polyprenyl glycosylphosphotransferase
VTLRQLVFSVGLLLCYLALVKDQVISRSFLVVYVPVLYCGLLLSNHYLPRMIAGRIFRGRKERTLFIGPASRLAKMRTWATQKAVLGIEVAGVLTEDPPATVTAGAFTYLGRPQDAERVIERESITRVVVLELPRAREAHRALIAVLERLGVRVLIQNNIEEMLAHPVVHLEDEGGMRFISLREEPLEDPLNRIMKRTLDLAVAIPVVVLVLPPLALLVWLLQCFQSPGPLFFRQRRAGIQNSEFTILKFRTMHSGNPDEGRQATHGDVRVFGAGRWLRRLSLDELPQFLNVLKGDMSVTGPRPHLIEHNVQFAREMANYNIRATVKPGITGLAQVRGFRGEVCSPQEIAHRLESDISYLENWRLALDIGIIARTIWQMIVPSRKAY